MIKLLRIDERLTHGQVANQWAKQLSVDAILVANDMAASNDLIKTSLRMAAPQGVKVVIKNIEDAITQLNDPRAEALQIFVVVNTPQDALKLVKSVKGIPYLNVGNFGRVNYETSNRKKYTECLFANDEEIATLKEIADTGLEVEIRMLNTDPKILLTSII